DLDRVHALLAKLRTRARKDLDELAKKQNATEAFKAKVKRDEVTRKAHPSQEKENPKGDIVLTPEQAEQLLAAYGPAETEDEAAVEAKQVQKRQAMNPATYTDTHPYMSRWPSGVVYYTFGK
ncbi:hypothetical protein AAVH_38767, partial [Aphelenchoides avenae]